MGTQALSSQAVARSSQLQSLTSLLQPQREQTCRVALRAMLTSDAATRKHLPQHLQDANQRKQTSPRSNASYSSAVAQAEEDFEAMSQQHLAELPQQPSTNSAQLGGSIAESGMRHAPMDRAEERLAHEEQVPILQSYVMVPIPDRLKCSAVHLTAPL